MKNFAIVLALLAAPILSQAQAPNQTKKAVRNDAVSFNGQKYPCFVYEYGSPADLVEQAIKETMLKAGYKPSKGPRNWLVYKTISLPSHGISEPTDLYIKVEENGKRDNLRSDVYVISTKPGLVSDEKPTKANAGSAAVGVVLAAGGAAFLTGLDTQVDEKQFDANLKTQSALATKEESRLENLKSEQRRLENRIKDLQDELADNLKQQELQMNVLAKEKAKLAGMREKKAPAEKKD
jgi:hypothetical protein